jgi:hypothetical protein
MSCLYCRVAGIRIDREAVGNDDFLEQADHENAHTDGNVRRQIPSLRRTDLWHDLGVVRDRTGDQLRKEGDEEGVIEQREVTHEAAVRVHEKGDLLERDERNPYWQDDARHRPLQSEDGVHVGNKKACVFEIPEKTQVEDDADRQEGA